MTKPTLEELLGNPSFEMPRISPDGKQLAWLAPDGGVLNIWVRPLDSGQAASDGPSTAAPSAPRSGQAKVLTKDRDRGIRWFEWSPESDRLLYLQDKGGDENWRLYGVDLEGGAERDYTPFDNVAVHSPQLSRFAPGQAVLMMNKDDASLHDAWRLDLGSSELALAAKNPGDVIAWYADAKLRVRACTASTPDGGGEVRVRDDEAFEWRKLLSWSPEEMELAQVHGFNVEGDRLTVSDPRDSPTNSLASIEIKSKIPNILAEDPDVVVDSLRVDPLTWEPEAVCFNKARKEWRPIHDSVAADYLALATLLPGDFELVSRDLADELWVVACIQDIQPLSYHLYRREDQSLELLFVTRPELSKYDLAPMKPVQFPSRDGLALHGYLSLPPDKPHKNLPLVLVVHGGPHVRDNWRFSPEVQWLCNLVGAAVLQVNYRGSAGYSKAFMQASERQWGHKMHDDLIDAVTWATSQGIADKKRIAIYGGSYGGYAALCGAAFTPDIFCCAVDIVGPSNLVTLLKSIPPYWKNYLAHFHRMVGHPEYDYDFLMSRSPISRVDQMKIPLLIAQGANDPRVKQAESEQIVAALKEKGIPHEYMLFPDEGHGFAKPENRLKFYRKAGEFLGKWLSSEHP